MTEALVLTEYLILKLLGKLDDLTPALVNTVVNTYHQTICSALEAESPGSGEAGENSGEVRDPEVRIRELGLIQPGRDNRILLMNRMIGSWRDIRTSEPPKAADYIAQVIIDTMVYGIEDAPRKSEIRRWFERRKRKKQGMAETGDLAGRIQVVSRKD